MSKALKRNKKQTGSFFENQDVRIEINYSDEAKSDELIKFTPKNKDFVISSGDILRLVQENFRQKDLALALTSVDTTFIASVEVAVPISFIANKDIAKGERVQFFAPFQMPLGVALVMEALKLCIVKGTEVIKIPREIFDEATKIDLTEKSREFTEKFFKPQVEQLKKLREEIQKEQTKN